MAIFIMCLKCFIAYSFTSFTILFCKFGKISTFFIIAKQKDDFLLLTFDFFS